MPPSNIAANFRRGANTQLDKAAVSASPTGRTIPSIACNPPKHWEPPVSAPSPGGAARRAVPLGLSPAIG
eukprot:15447262-Alexandrium_andersonii.AAC.1